MTQTYNLSNRNVLKKLCIYGCYYVKITEIRFLPVFPVLLISIRSSFDCKLFFLSPGKISYQNNTITVCGRLTSGFDFRPEVEKYDDA